MEIIKITLTNDMLKLISNINFTEVPQINRDDEFCEIPEKKLTWGIDFYSLFGGSFVLEDIAYILGRYDEHIEGTENGVQGPRFEDDLEEYMLEMYHYIVSNIKYIESLVHWYVNKGGLTEGTYKCKSNELIWSKI